MATKDDELKYGVYGAEVANAQKPEYPGTYDQKLSDIYDQISTRPDFRYDVNADPLYQQYKDNFIQQGKLAMKDTMGQAAALTGGYGSTYGQQVGQQSYDAYLQNLSAAIPELYGAAYDKYRDEGDDMLTQYSLLGDQRDTEYGRYRDQIGDYENEREYQRQLENENYNRRVAEEESSYSRKQQEYSNLYAIIKASGYAPTDDELAASGMTREAANALAAEYQRQITPVVSGGSSGGGGGGGGGSSSSNKTLAIQQQLNAMGAGLAEDGIWGPKTQAAYDALMGGGGNAGSADRTVDVNGKATTVNNYGEVRNGSNPTRGETARAAEQAYRNGEITYQQYKTVIASVH